MIMTNVSTNSFLQLVRQLTREAVHAEDRYNVDKDVAEDV
jgi:hypothetical protein